jgi:hypothetical protein
MPSMKRPKKLKQVKFKMKFSWKNIIIYAFLIIFTGFLFLGVNSPSGTSSNQNPVKTVPLSQLIGDVKQGRVTSMDVYTNKIDAFLPILLMVAFFYFIFSQARGAQENVFSFGQSKAKAL